ncbi:MAG TPA: carboxypeptidase regulatory-like domain-containing protein [Thermoanaerobaculia bacterium]|jgi:plastocyanin|nr:carboxypeptidase regulatory-like domain-containing protein [Thermoanaerobaculia bacterium]
MKQRKFFARGLVGSLGIFLMAACGGRAPEVAGAPEGTQGTATTAGTEKAADFPPADAGSVEGQVSYAGPDPDVALPLTADPTCAKLRTTPLESEKIVGDGAGHLGNVFVYVKSGLPPRSYPAPTDKIEIDQLGCAYLPRVVGVRVGQPLVLKNSDSTIHNVFAQAGANPQFNRGLPYAGMSFEKVFEAPQVMVTLKCNVHPWMTAYVGVLDHPYFAVTGPDGKFTIPNLPPGTYTLEAWHETLGVREAVVTVEKGQAGRVEVEFGR